MESSRRALKLIRKEAVAEILCYDSEREESPEIQCTPPQSKKQPRDLLPSFTSSTGSTWKHGMWVSLGSIAAMAMALMAGHF